MASVVDRFITYYLPTKRDDFLQGIIHHSLEKGVSITTDASTTLDNYKSDYIIEQGKLENPYYFHSETEESNSWVEIKFTSAWIIPTMFVIADSPNVFRLRNWEVQGSRDGKSYETLDSHKDDQTFQNQCQIEAFKPKQRPHRSYRIFRIQQTGNLTNGELQGVNLRVGRFEIFGMTAFCNQECLTPPSFPQIFTCKQATRYTFISFMSFLLIFVS